MTIALYALVLTEALFVFYLAYVAILVAKKNGKLDTAPRIVRAVCWLNLAFAVCLDALFNVTLGSIIFLEPPELHRLMFTARCAKWRDDRGYRGAIATWVCDGWLNPFQANHC